MSISPPSPRRPRAAGAEVYGPVAQGRFLRKLGIEARAAALMRARDAGPGARRSTQATRRLIDPPEMGSLFKVLALGRAALAAPPGFESTP